jgi:hypothetical protein
MCKRLFSFLIITILFMVMCERSWGATCTATGTPPNCTNSFSPGNTVGVYNFPGDGSSLRVEFVGGVKTTFTLTVTEFTLTDAQLAARLDPKVFPPDTTSCFHYGSPPPPPSTQTTPGCQEYAFTGNASGPNGVPVKNVDYGPPIKLTLTYFSFDTVNDPAFGHAPGESTTFSEDILVDYFKPFEDDTMDGSTPSLSSVIALNKKLEENDKYCWVSPSSGQTFKVGDEVQVAFQLFASGPCIGNTGTSIRDNFARLSLVNNQGVFQPVRSDEGGKNFQFDNHDKVNEREFSTAGLAPGFYFITVRSTKFSPQTRQIHLVP